MKKTLSKITAKAQSRWKITLFTLVSLMVLAGALVYWDYSNKYVSTEDAYINADVVMIAPRVTGQVAELHVNNNQYVNKGQLLFVIDDALFKVAEQKAQSQYDIEQANFANIEATWNRTMLLVEKNVLSAQTGDDVNTKLTNARASLNLAKANLEEAKLKLAYTKVYAPSSGWISNMTLREGNNVAEYQPVFAVISDKNFWVDANFKETELTNIETNQQASIKVDMYPAITFNGIVESISGGSGTAFSLMPPQNATGNWVKVTQRVPVRVKITNTDTKHPLRIGTSAKVTVHLLENSSRKI